MAAYPDPNEVLRQVESTEEDRLDFVQDALRRVDEVIAHADNKAATIGAANIGLISLLLAFVALAGQSSGLKLTGQQSTIITVLFLLYLVPSVTSLILAFDAVFPRLRGKSTSLYYFAHFSQFASAADLNHTLREATCADRIDAVVEQIWQVSRIAQTKYARLAWSVRLCMISGLLWLLIVISIFLVLISRLT